MKSSSILAALIAAIACLFAVPTAANAQTNQQATQAAPLVAQASTTSGGTFGECDIYDEQAGDYLPGYYDVDVDGGDVCVTAEACEFEDGTTGFFSYSYTAYDVGCFVPDGSRSSWGRSSWGRSSWGRIVTVRSSWGAQQSILV